MKQTAREYILKKLKNSPRQPIPAKPDPSFINVICCDMEETIRTFSEEVIRQSGRVHRVKNYEEAFEKLTEIASAEGLKKIIASTDNVIAPLSLSEWGRQNQIQVFSHEDFMDQDAFKRSVFDEADADITGVDYAIAESGTLCLIHDKNQPRLISIAPIMHIAIVLAERVFSVYEQVVEKITADKDNLPSQFTFITGPSMTADIQATAFRGMHGPKHLIIILIG